MTVRRGIQLECFIFRRRREKRCHTKRQPPKSARIAKRVMREGDAWIRHEKALRQNGQRFLRLHDVLLLNPLSSIHGSWDDCLSLDRFLTSVYLAHYVSRLNVRRSFFGVLLRWWKGEIWLMVPSTHFPSTCFLPHAYLAFNLMHILLSLLNVGIHYVTLSCVSLLIYCIVPHLHNFLLFFSNRCIRIYVDFGKLWRP